MKQFLLISILPLSLLAMLVFGLMSDDQRATERENTPDIEKLMIDTTVNKNVGRYLFDIPPGATLIESYGRGWASFEFRNMCFIGQGIGRRSGVLTTVPCKNVKPRYR